jgi:hypothetical protein
MVNSFAPFGFRSVKRPGAAWTGGQTTRLIAANNTTPIFNGDVVQALATGYISVATDNTAGTNLGVFVGCAFLDPTSGFWRWNRHWPGVALARDAQAFILDDPGVVLRVQTTGSAPITAADIGFNIGFVASTGNTLSGSSTFAANAATAGVAATFPFRVVGIPEPNMDPNTDNASANNVIYVAWNNQFYNQRTGI